MQKEVLATSDVHILNNVGIVFGGDGADGAGADMVISANNLTIDVRAADISLDAARLVTTSSFLR